MSDEKKSPVKGKDSNTIESATFKLPNDRVKSVGEAQNRTFTEQELSTELDKNTTPSDNRKKDIRNYFPTSAEKQTECEEVNSHLKALAAQAALVNNRITTQPRQTKRYSLRDRRECKDKVKLIAVQSPRNTKTNIKDTPLFEVVKKGSIAQLIKQAENFNYEVTRASTPVQHIVKSNLKNNTTNLDQSVLSEDEESIPDGFFTPLGQSLIDQSFSEEPIKYKYSETAPSLHQTTMPPKKNKKLSTSNHTAEQQSSDEKEMEIQQTEDSASSNPEVIGVSTVMAMMRKIEAQLGELKEEKKKEMEELKEICNDQVMDNIDQNFQTNDRRIKSLSQEIGHLRFKSKVQTEVIQRLYNTVEDLTQKIENLEVSQAKKAITLTGLTCSENKEEAIEQIYDFFVNNMGIETNIDDYYHLGNTTPRTIVVIFQNYADRRNVLKNKAALKGLQNEYHRPYYINEYQPTITNERKRRERQIIQQNEQLQSKDQLAIEYTRDGLKIQNELYKKKVSVPSPDQLINIPLEKLDAVLKMKTVKGNEITQQRSIFKGFTAKVTTHEQINNLYMKMKLNHPYARHIVCAYSIPGEEKHYTNDFCDDEEPGAGRTLLQLLNQYEISERVIFVTRVYGGQKMSSDRFECYKQAGKLAIMQDDQYKNSTLRQVFPPDNPRNNPQRNNPEENRRNTQQTRDSSTSRTQQRERYSKQHSSSPSLSRRRNAYRSYSNQNSYNRNNYRSSRGSGHHRSSYQNNGTSSRYQHHMQQGSLRGAHSSTQQNTMSATTTRGAHVSHLVRSTSPQNSYELAPPLFNFSSPTTPSFLNHRGEVNRQEVDGSQQHDVD